MSRTQRPPERVVVVGGGIIGVSTATHLQRGGASVVLVTEGELGDGASGRSLAWLNSAGTRSRDYHALRMAGIDRYRTLLAADPGRDWLRFDGGLHWTAPGQRAQVEDRHRHEVAHGYDSWPAGPREAGARVPGVDPAAIPEIAVHNPGEGWVSLPHLIEHLVGEFTRLGGEVVRQAGRASVVARDSAAHGVTTTAGHRFDADVVVVACGAATPSVVAEHGVHIPDRSPLSMLVLTEPARTRVRAVLNTPRVAMRPHPGGAYALDHSWYEDRIVESAGGCTIDESVVKELVAEASHVLAGDEELSAASWKLGRKPIPGDGEPVFGELTELPGCVVAFTHSGATLGLVAGELLSHEILSGARHPMLAAFRPERFRR
ncbi:NAD(P)/FAD-dependent oxidoreductase [Pseudonocardia kunmingensis]|uniref:Glycine/D-amino acid oxidase-like deaminating enzyme n=1 Tax=Pseudonocardia kunmingensis TaxID=630975 RepID=A0A543DHZ4_9PSEU|nr:FAD-binding oxidoreductase [Pseudonocardia kunmingensis]TQM08933.1 glycine/D-amino acid oxidase-like deaminating enzyme [Pseudonocardia kunmingensis]